MRPFFFTRRWLSNPRPRALVWRRWLGYRLAVVFSQAGPFVKKPDPKPMSNGEATIRKSQSVPIAFASRLAGSQAFDALFKDGMALVEETASYLDGPGRADSRCLTRAGSIAYAIESMRLTTRLMQLASWLLLQRAVNNGELTAQQAAAEKVKVNLSGPASATDGRGWDDLPERLRDLIERSTQLQTRIRHLDCAIGGKDTVPSETDNPVRRQLGRLAEAFAAQ